LLARKRVYDDYKGLFGAGSEEPTEISFEDVEQEFNRQSEDQRENREDKGEAGYNAKWGWLICIDRVAGGNPLKYEQVYNIKLIEFLNILSFLRIKRSIIMSRQRKCTKADAGWKENTDRVRTAPLRASKKYGEDITSAIKQKLAEADKLASGSLYKSIQFEIEIDNTIIGLSISGNDYLKWVDEGRRPGQTQPPIDAILKWIQSRKIKANDTTRRNALGRFSRALSYHSPAIPWDSLQAAPC